MRFAQKQKSMFFFALYRTLLIRFFFSTTLTCCKATIQSQIKTNSAFRKVITLNMLDDHPEGLNRSGCYGAIWAAGFRIDTESDANITKKKWS